MSKLLWVGATALRTIKGLAHGQQANSIDGELIIFAVTHGDDPFYQVISKVQCQKN